jgi:hypothetical protein
MISDVVQTASEFIREYDPKLADMGLTIIDIAKQDMQERRIAMIERL